MRGSAVTVIDVDDLLSAEVDENELRKDFTLTEAEAIGALIEEQERPKAIERRRAGNVAGGLSEVGAESAPTSGDRVREIAARAVGMGKTRYNQAKTIVAAAKDAREDAKGVREPLQRAAGKHLTWWRRNRRMSTRQRPRNEC